MRAQHTSVQDKIEAIFRPRQGHSENRVGVIQWMPPDIDKNRVPLALAVTPAPPTLIGTDTSQPDPFAIVNSCVHAHHLRCRGRSEKQQYAIMGYANDCRHSIVSQIDKLTVLMLGPTRRTGNNGRADWSNQRWNGFNKVRS